MPFLRTYDIWTQQQDGFIWRYRPGELIDLSIIEDTPRLVMMSDQITRKPLKMPSLATINFRNLEQLEIQEFDVSDMDRIPESVTNLRVVNTNLTNVNQINVNWRNIISLTLEMNKNLNKNSVAIPEGVQQLMLGSQHFTIVRLPSTIKILQLASVVISDMITGTLPDEELNCADVYTIYRAEFKRILSACIVEKRASLAFDEDMINRRWHVIKLEYIKQVNDAAMYQVYLDFGSIPRRIKNAYEHRVNPIVSALNLASNVPRRMAEFVTESTRLG